VNQIFQWYFGLNENFRIFNNMVAYKIFIRSICSWLKDAVLFVVCTFISLCFTLCGVCFC